MSSHRKPKVINPAEVDPSVYYYDEVYDEIKRDSKIDLETQLNKDGSKVQKPQGSKYIQGIIETAKRRQVEREIRKFKKYAQDREEAEANGELERTDVYVTNSYKKKLEEVRNSVQELTKSQVDGTLNSFKVEGTCNKEKLPSFENDTIVHSLEQNKSTCDKSISDMKHVREENSTCNLLNINEKQKTLDERREYLKRVLAKRTVGEVFENARNRYRQRLAKSH